MASDGETGPLTVGVIGAGKAGTAIARLALRAGHHVRIARAGSREELEFMLEVVAPGAAAVTPADAAVGADLVVLAVPLARHRDLPAAALAGAVVVDAMNYWPAVDGRMADFEGPRSSSEVVQRSFPGARLVKALNHVGYRELEDEARPADAADRQAIAVAGDDSQARAVVAAFVRSLGFDVIDVGGLPLGRLLEPGGSVFGRPIDVSAARQLAEEAAELRLQHSAGQMAPGH